MKVNKLNGIPLLCLVSGFILLIECQVTSSQTFQHLSYANAELGQKLIRPTHSTTPSSASDINYSLTTIDNNVTTTPKSTGFFNGIRNFFSRNSPQLSTTVRPVRPNAVSSGKPPGRSNVHPSIAASLPQQNILPTLPQTSGDSNHLNAAQFTPTTQRARSPMNEDFPALSPRRSQQNRPSVTPPTAKPSNPSSPAWSNQGNQGAHHTTPHNAWSDVRRHGGSLPNLAVITTTHRPSYVLPTSKSLSNINAGGHSGNTKNNNNNNNYSNNNKKSDTPTATEAEIEALSEILFDKSTPNIFPSIHVNLQGRTYSSERVDKAPEPLIQVDESIMDATQTLIKMRALFDNYEADASINEHVTPNERREENEFLNAVLDTQVMRTAMKFLQDKGVVTADPKTHYDLLKTIWFTVYSRISGKVGSSGFEHVFLHEIKNNTVGGLHNWVYFYYKESGSGAKPSLDYQGYIKSVPLGSKGQYVKFRSIFDGVTKPVNGALIGTLPELEMALYTVCFEMHLNDCPISLGGTKIAIKTYPYKYRGKRLIGSAFFS